MRKKLLILLLLFCFILTKVSSQIVHFNKSDVIDFNKLPKKYENSTIYVSEKKTGKLLELKSFKNGKKHGLFLSYSPPSLLVAHYTEINYKNDILHGYFNNIDTKGFYKNGKKDKLWQYSDDIGNYKQISYKKGIKHGPCRFSDMYMEKNGFYKNGKKDKLWIIKEYDPESYQEINYKNGKEYGISYYKSSNDFYTKTNYKKGMQHGRYFSSDGIIKETIYYKNNKKHGKYKFINPFEEEKGFYKLGKKDGKWTKCTIVNDLNKTDHGKKDCIVKYYSKGVLINDY